MGLFHRREERQTEVLYHVGIGLEKTTLVVGLGNPGAKYNGTRHNIGFYCADALVAAEDGSWSEKKQLKSSVAELRVGQSRIIVCKPTTYMNLSGEAVRAVQDYFKISNDNTIVVHDELDLPFGQIRSRIGGSAGGHNGIKSLIMHCGEDFGRVRIGIANEFSDKVDSADFVLQKFSKTEQDALKPLQTEVVSVLNEAIFGGSLTPETRSFL